VLTVVFVERAQHEFADDVHLGVGSLALVAAEEEPVVRKYRAHRCDDGGDTGGAGRGHCAQHDHRAADQGDLDDFLQIDRLEQTDHAVDRVADDLLRDADRLEQVGQTGLD